MRTRLLSFGIIFLTLFAGGWGNVTAAMLCPHIAQGHSCHLSATEDHNSPVSSHVFMKNMDAMSDMDGMNMRMSPVPVANKSGSITSSFAKPTDGCGHCMGYSKIPNLPAAAIASDYRRQDARYALQEADVSLARFSPSFKQTISARQGAPPPGRVTPRHILISVFLI